MHPTQTIQTLLQAIQKNQAYDGSFISITSANSDSWEPKTERHTSFITSLLLNALAVLQEDFYQEASTIARPGISFLLGQNSDIWSFNYWSREAPEYLAMKYPDDLDDTFCALSALFLWKKEIVDGEVFAHIVKVLTFAEENEGGPYRTWLVPAETTEWYDVDPVVNSNIRYFLSLSSIELTGLDAYLDTVVEEELFSSKYYSSPIIILYFIARSWTDRSEYTEKLIQEILKRQKEGLWDNGLETAMAVSSPLSHNPSFCRFKIS